MKGGLKTRFLIGNAKARLGQLRSTISTRDLSIFTGKQVAVLDRKALFIPPNTWKRLCLRFKLHVGGGKMVALALQEEGLFAGLSITKGGQLRVNAYNTTYQVMYLTPKIAMANA